MIKIFVHVGFALTFLIAIRASATTYDVGPGMLYENIGNVPWEALSPGDSVRIHYRPNPYHEKWVIARTGTESDSIVIQGVPGQGGELPIIDGENATTRLQLDYWSEERAIINVGGSNYPSQFPEYIVIENLEIRNAKPPYQFVDDAGDTLEYSVNAASIDVIEGDHITVRNCIIHNCANGIFTCHNARNIVIESNYIYGNGLDGNGYLHNSYTESQGIIFQFNHYGHLIQGCVAENLKDRSSGTVIRYNWIQGGNRELDLVDSDYPELYNDSMYRKTFVYGNILYEDSDDGNSQILHYGGDGGNTSQYRKGTLYFYNNTVISERSGNTTLMNLSTNDEHCDMRNNIVYNTQNGAYLAMLDAHGILIIKNNWLKDGWVNSFEGGNFQGSVIDSGGIVTGSFPGFEDWAARDFHLTGSSNCIDAGTSLSEEVFPDYDVLFQYVKHCQYEIRPHDSIFDIGAYEYVQQYIDENSKVNVYPNPCRIYLSQQYITFNDLISGDLIKVYDITGKLIHNSGRVSGMVYRWDVRSMRSGVYFYKIIGGDEVERKIIIIR